MATGYGVPVNCGNSPVKHGAPRPPAQPVNKRNASRYFSDVFADRRVPAALRDDPVLLGECLAGARTPSISTTIIISRPGDAATHFGLFDCGPVAAAASKDPAGACC